MLPVRCADEPYLSDFRIPLIGFLLLSFSRGRFSENLSALIGVGSVGLSAHRRLRDLAIQRRPA
jgi:hypothetical protein